MCSKKTRFMEQNFLLVEHKMELSQKSIDDQGSSRMIIPRIKEWVTWNGLFIIDQDYCSMHWDTEKLQFSPLWVIFGAQLWTKSIFKNPRLSTVVRVLRRNMPGKPALRRRFFTGCGSQREYRQLDALPNSGARLKITTDSKDNQSYPLLLSKL